MPCQNSQPFFSLQILAMELFKRKYLEDDLPNLLCKLQKNGGGSL